MINLQATDMTPVIDLMQDSQATISDHLDEVDPSCYVVENGMSPASCSALLEALEDHPWIPVGLDGILKNYTDGDPIGSWRLSCYCPDLAAAMWERMQMVKECWPIREGYRAIGVNPLMRLIRYRQSGLLVPHFDAPYLDDATGQITLSTLVFYLENKNCVGGKTRFIEDPQTAIDRSLRDFSDWTRTARPDEIVAEPELKVGRLLTFEHRILHDSEPLESGQKTILRTDVVYEKI